MLIGGHCQGWLIGGQCQGWLIGGKRWLIGGHGYNEKLSRSSSLNVVIVHRWHIMYVRTHIP